MEVYSGDVQLTEDVAVALGTFDGLHMGHMRVLEMTKKSGLKSAAVTFSNIPSAYFGGGEGCIFTTDEKIRAFSKTGIDYLILMKFDGDIAAMSPEAFIDFLARRVRAKYICAGFDYTFGRNAEGDVRLLKELSAKMHIKTAVSDALYIGGQPVSSTRIRKALACGDVEEAERMLGEPYSFTAQVTMGKQLGRTLGFPTANFYPQEEKLCPKYGVYASIVQYQGRTYPAITNIGSRPTVLDGDRVNVETYIMGFNKEIYGEIITVYIKKRLRGEVRFNGLDELKMQLEMDRKAAREILGAK